MTKNNNLTAREIRFIECYLPHRNGARAAREAGYSEKTADVIAHQLLGKALVLDEIKRRAAIIAKDAEFSAKEAINRLAYISRGNIKSFIDSDGFISIERFSELPDEITYSVESIQVIDTEYGKTIKFKLCDKIDAIKTLIELLGYDKQPGESDALSELKDALKSLNEKK